jgi:hypothetical protein
LGEPLRFQKKRRSTYVLWRFFCRLRRAIRSITFAARFALASVVPLLSLSLRGDKF